MDGIAGKKQRTIIYFSRAGCRRGGTKEIYKAIIVRVKKKICREDGSAISFSKNSVVLLNAKGSPIGSRIFGPVTKELRTKKNIKLISLCTKML